MKAFLISCFILVIVIWLIAVVPSIPLGVVGDVTWLRILNYSQKWQALIAALVALIAALFAYSAAMAKVRFDEKIATQNECRKILGIFLRFDFAMDVYRYEASHVATLSEQPDLPTQNNTIVVNDLAFTDMPEVKEAWANLDYFPIGLSRAFYLVQNDLYNFSDFKKENEGEAYHCEYGMARAEELDSLRSIVLDLEEHSKLALEEVRGEIAKLRKQMS